MMNSFRWHVLRLAPALALLAADIAEAAPPPLAVPFVANEGQHDARVAFVARLPQAVVFVTRDGEIVHSLPGAGGAPGHAIVERLVRAMPPRPEAGSPAAVRVSDFRGPDESRWRSGLASYADVSLGEPWPGIGVTLAANARGAEKIFAVAPGASPSAIVLEVDGAGPLRLEAGGALRLDAGPRRLRFTAPIAWQERDGLREPVEVSYRVKGRGRYGFVLGAYDGGRTVFIDPALQATWYGGTGAGAGGDEIRAMAVHPSTGEVYVAGKAASTTFPGVAGAQPANAGSPDAFVARFNAGLTALLSATYLGSTGADEANAIAIDAAGAIHVAGSAGAAFGGQTHSSAALDAFLAKLSANLGTLTYVRLLGSNGGDTVGTAVAAIPAAGNSTVYLVGHAAGNLPTASPNQGSPAAFVAKYTSGTRNWVSARGTTGAESTPLAAVADAAENVYVAGRATASFWGTPTATTVGAFVAKYDNGGGSPVAKLILDGNGVDEARAIALDAAGRVVVAGTTASATLGGQARSGASDAFVARFPATLASPELVQLFGGTGAETGRALAIGPFDSIYLGGTTTTTNLASTYTMTQAIQATHGNGATDGFVAWLFPPDARRATYLGGAGADAVLALAMGADSTVYAAGASDSATFPGTTGGYQAAKPGTVSTSGFVAALNAGLTTQATIPDTTITSGPSGTTNSRSVQFTFTSTVGGSTFLCRHDGGAWAACASPVTRAAMADGAYTFEVVAWDAWDNVDPTPASRAFTVAGPAVAFLPSTLPFGAVGVGSAAGPSSVTVLNTGAGTLTLDAVEVQSSPAGFTLDAFACAPLPRTLAEGASCDLNVSFAPGSAASFAGTVTVTDKDGFVDPALWQVASMALTGSGIEPPQTTITAGPADPTPATGATFAFVSSVPGSTFTCTLDGGMAAPCVSPVAYAGLAPGPHSFSVFATFGVADPTPATFAWTVQPSWPVAVAKAGTGAGTVTSTPAGIDCGATCGGDFLQGSSVALAAVPAPGSRFEGWSGDCAGLGACELAMAGARSVTASFAALPPTGDEDGDGIPNGVELAEGRDPLVKDNDIFSPGAAAARLFAMQQYRDFLGREGDPAGIQGWADAVAGGSWSRTQVIDAFVQSAEFGGFVAPVVRLYFATFLRVPDYAGLVGNAALVRSGTVTLTQLADFFTASPEFAATYGALDNTQFLTLLYNNVLQRAPDPAGLDGWVALLEGGMSRGQVLLGFSDSTEYQGAMASEVLVTMMYASMLRRTPEPAGFNGWVGFLDAATYTREQVIDGFFLSAEYRGRFLP
jgi:hypothetical protein